MRTHYVRKASMWIAAAIEVKGITNCALERRDFGGRQHLCQFDTALWAEAIFGDAATNVAQPVLRV